MNNKLVYFCTRPFLLGITYSLIIGKSMQDSLICLIIGTILGTLFISVIHKLDLNNKYAKVLLFICYILFIIIASSVLETFTSSFFLTNTPKIIIIIPSIILCLYSVFNGLDSIKRTISILYYISLFLIIICFLSLLKLFNISNIIPFFITSKSNLLKSILSYAILTSFPNIVLYNQNIKKSEHIKSYLYSNIINFLVLLFTLVILTPYVAKIYSFPEYMVLKRIKILNFIENIENIMASIWYLDLYVFMALTYNNIYTLFKNNKIVLTIIVFLTNLFTTYCILNNYSILLDLYNYSYIVLFILFILFLPNLLNKKRESIST